MLLVTTQTNQQIIPHYEFYNVQNINKFNISKQITFSGKPSYSFEGHSKEININYLIQPLKNDVYSQYNILFNKNQRTFQDIKNNEYSFNYIGFIDRGNNNLEYLFNIYSKKFDAYVDVGVFPNEKLNFENLKLNNDEVFKLLYDTKDILIKTINEQLVPKIKTVNKKTSPTIILSNDITTYDDIDFWSSWGVYNGDSGRFKASAKIDVNDIKNKFNQIHNGLFYDKQNINLSFKTIEFTLRKLDVNPPFRNLYLKIDRISLNNPNGLFKYDYYSNKKLDIGNIYESGQEWTNGFVQGVAVAGGGIAGGISAIGTSISSIISSIAIGAAGSIISSITGSLVSNLTSESYESYLNNEVAKLGDSKKLNFNNLIDNTQISFNFTLDGNANATSLYGDLSKLNVKNVLIGFILDAQIEILDI